MTDRSMNRTSILSAYIDEVARRPFAPGENDCLLMVAGAVERLTGVDHAADYRGRYSTIEEGKALVGGDLLGFVASILPEIPEGWRGAHDGDIAAMQHDGDWAFGVIAGPNIYAVTPDGLGVLPRSAALKAFKVM